MLHLRRAIWDGLGRARPGYLALAIFCFLISFSIWANFFLLVGIIAVFRGRFEISKRHGSFVTIGFLIGIISILLAGIATYLDPDLLIDNLEGTVLFLITASAVLNTLVFYFIVFNIYPKNLRLMLHIIFGVLAVGGIVIFIFSSGSVRGFGFIHDLILAIILFTAFGMFDRAKNGWEKGGTHNGGTGYSRGHIGKDGPFPVAEGRVNIKGFLAAGLGMAQSNFLVIS